MNLDLIHLNYKKEMLNDYSNILVNILKKHKIQFYSSIFKLS